jgi:hypothetical protein
MREAFLKVVRGEGIEPVHGKDWLNFFAMAKNRGLIWWFK